MNVYQPVPAKYVGVWQRELLETATSKDMTSLVLWMQTQHEHIDIRIPATDLNMPIVDKLDDYTNEELCQLACQQGFAGITQITPNTATSSDICQWHRQIDYQPKTDARDIGKMVFTDDNTVIETGLDDNYLEVWRRLQQNQMPCLSARVMGKNRTGLEMPAYLLRCGNWVAYARPRLAELPKTSSLTNLIQTHQPNRKQLLDFLDMEISFGEVLNDKNWKTSWTIKHSTLPFKNNKAFSF